jgi:predicted DNA-binding protein
MKTLAIRLEDDLHAQLSVIAQLAGTTVTDEIRQAIEAQIAHRKAMPEISAKASGVLEEIEREAAQRRSAIATLFESPSEGESTTKPKGTSRSRPPEPPADD